MSEALEHFLRTANVTSIHSHAPPSQQVRRYVLLEGGVAAIAKWNIDDGIGPRGQIGFEVAAWLLARACGFPDLVPTTVLRPLPQQPENDPVDCSLQAFVADTSIAGDLSGFDETLVVRAAIFDYIVGPDSRSSVDNWLAVTAADRKRPVLIDHGDAFVATSQIKSLFVDRCAGKPVGAQLLAPLAKAFGNVARLTTLEGQPLLGSFEIAAVEERLDRILTYGALPN